MGTLEEEFVGKLLLQQLTLYVGMDWLWSHSPIGEDISHDGGGAYTLEEQIKAIMA